MPTYDYVCDACEHTFELFQSITAEPEKRCPKCKKLKLRRLFGTGAGVIFKGSGFYTTDYRSDSYQKAAKADKPSADTGKGDSGKKEGGSGESKSSDKPAAEKTEKKPSESKPKKKKD
jgi:putative FmdB family regulatory protein